METTATLNKVRKLLHKPDTSIQDLRQMIVKDRSLTDRLITLTKSYGFPPEAWNVTSAIILLGFGTIRSIVNEQLHSNARIH